MVANAKAPLPGPLEPTEAFHFPSRDDLELYGEFHAAKEPRAVALVLHGYAEHCGRYREVAHVLVDAGISTLTFDMRGHGRSSGPRGNVRRFEKYLGDVEAAFDQLDKRTDTSLPLMLLCHSHGSLVGLRLLADPWRAPKRLRCAVLSSPFLAVKMKVPALKYAAAQVLGRVLPTLSLPSGMAVEDLTRDPDKLAERKVDTLCHDVAGARWFIEAQKTQDWVTEFAGRIEIPTLWIVAGDDRVVDAAASQRAFERVTADARWEDFPDSYHEVLNDLDRGRAFALIQEFCDTHLPV